MMYICTVPLDEIPYVDNPELRLNKHESTQMPFRYVRGEKGEPVMPEVSSSNTLHLHLLTTSYLLDFRRVPACVNCLFVGLC